MKKRILSLTLALAACLSLTIAAQAAAPFTDVPPDHWAYADIQKCCDQGIVNGYTNGAFGPRNTVTGAHFATMLARMFYPDQLAANSGLSSQGWYMPALQTAYNANLLTGTSRLAGGCSDNWKSSANLALNRYDMAQMLHNILAARNVTASAGEQNAVRDSIVDWNSIPAQYRTAVQNCYALGVLTGMSNGTFSGNADMNRAQACVVMNRAVNYTASADNSGTQKPPVTASHTLTIQYKKEGEEGIFQPTHTSQVKEGAAYSVTSPAVAGYTASQTVVSGTMGKTNVTVVVRYKPNAAAKTPEELSAEVVALVNAERAKQNLPALGTFGTLTAAAEIRAPELVKLFEHTRPDGTACFTALDEAGVNYYMAGENIAAGSSTAAGVMEMWMNSPGHKANILHKSFTHIGVACVKSGSSYYWVQMFVSSSTPSSGTGTAPAVSVEISPSTLELTAGETGSVTAKAVNTSASVTYTSSNQTVATVNRSTGKITAKKAGTAVITASVSVQGKSYTAQCTVTVTEKKDVTPPPQTESKTPEELSAEVVALVNAERAKKGLPALGTLKTLTAAAEIRAPELAKLFEHTRPDNRDCFTALDEAHVSNVYLAGENIAAGSRTAEDVMQMWMNSPGHKSNILHKDFTHIGVACYKSGSSYYWVQMFISTPTTSENPGTTPDTPSNPDAETPGGSSSGTPSVPSRPSGGSQQLTSTDLPADGRTTYYREEWGDGEYMEIQVLNGRTVKLSGCRVLDDSLYNAVVLWAFGDNVNYTAFHSGQPFSVSVDIDADRLLEIYEGDETRATSRLITAIAQNYRPSDKGTTAGVSFRTISDIALGLDGSGGIELRLWKR